MQPSDWDKSHLGHHSYKKILDTSIQFNNALMLLLADRLNIFDTLESSLLDSEELKLKLGLKCDSRILIELLDFLVENKYLEKILTKEEGQIILPSSSNFSLNPSSEKISFLPENKNFEILKTKYKNSNLGKKLCKKIDEKNINLNSSNIYPSPNHPSHTDYLKNYSNILYLMERTLSKFNIADENLKEGREYNITNHLHYNEKDLVHTLYAIEKLYSFSYDNFLKNFDFSWEDKSITKIKNNKSISIIGGGVGKLAETIKLIYPNSDVKIIDDKSTEHIVKDYLKKQKMENHIYFMPIQFEKENELIPNSDIFIVSYIIHWNNLEKNKLLFRKVIDSLNRNGKFVIIEFMYDKDENSREIFSKFGRDNSTEKIDTLDKHDKHDDRANMISFFNSGFSILNDYNGYSPRIKEILMIAKEVGFNCSEIIRTEGMANIVIFSKEMIL
jgi:hypothetical protein